MIITAAAENSNSSEKKRAGIRHREDCWIQTLEIDGVRKQLSRPKCLQKPYLRRNGMFSKEDLRRNGMFSKEDLQDLQLTFLTHNPL